MSGALPLAKQPASRLQRIARADRDALKELLATHGALIDAALAARDLGGADADGARDQIVRSMWMAAALWSGPAPDERAFVMAHALAEPPLSPLQGTGLDAALVTRLCARVVAGIAPVDEVKLLAAQGATDARVADAARLLAVVHEQIGATAPGAGQLMPCWERLAPVLK